MTFGVAADKPIKLAASDSPRLNLNATGPVKAVFLNIFTGEGQFLERANFTLSRYEEVQPFSLVVATIGRNENFTRQYGVRIEDNGMVIRFEQFWQDLTVEAAWLADDSTTT